MKYLFHFCIIIGLFAPKQANSQCDEFFLREYPIDFFRAERICDTLDFCWISHYFQATLDTFLQKKSSSFSVEKIANRCACNDTSGYWNSLRWDALRNQPQLKEISFGLWQPIPSLIGELKSIEKFSIKGMYDSPNSNDIGENCINYAKSFFEQCFFDFFLYNYEIPSGIYQLPNLKHLQLAGQAVSDDLAFAKKLEFFAYIYYAATRHFPTDKAVWAGLNSLKEIEIYALNELPVSYLRGIAAAPQLDILHLYFIYPREKQEPIYYPSFIDSCLSYMSANPSLSVYSIKTTFGGTSGFADCAACCPRYNHWTRFSKQIVRITPNKKYVSLDSLTISSFSIDSLSLSFLSFPELRYLDLRCNYIHHLSLTDAKKSKLEHLILSNNDLKYLPNGITQLTQLKVLEIPYNIELLDIPKGLRRLKNLEKVVIDLEFSPELLEKLQQRLSPKVQIEKVSYYNRKGWQD